MPTSRVLIQIHTLAVLGLLVSLVAAQHHHGNIEADVDVSELPKVQCVPPKPMTMADMEGFPDNPTYFAHPEHVGTVFAHIILMTLAWVFALPLAVMLSIGESRLGLPAQLLFHICHWLGMATGIAYDASTPDLYPGNAHHTAGWVISWLAVAWTALSVFKRRMPRTQSHIRKASYQSMTQENMAEYQRLTTDSGHFSRFSADSGQGSERNTESLDHTSRSPSTASEMDIPANKPLHLHTEHDHFEDDYEKRAEFVQHSTLLAKILHTTASRSRRVLDLTRVMLERSMILFTFLMMLTGLVTYSGIGRGDHVFNILAHLIKGGIFFCYGFLTFGRWLGSFGDLGWAWNLKPGADVVGKRKASMPSAEFIESAVIAFYGGSNVFLEHLSAWGKAWSPMDLEHVSITILFFGGGVLGMLIESTTIRTWLSASISNTSNHTSTRPSHSLNVLPATVIFLLGLMMSSHTQHSLISGQIHRQWGALLASFALARSLTYITLWLKPPASMYPSRPPSEVVASFCLVSGGAIFMASNKDTIHALEVYELDSMFVFTVCMGLTSLLMAWAMFVVAVKGWAVRGRAARFALPATPVTP